jgi:hypothetical protein
MPNPLKNFLTTALLSFSLFALLYLPIEFLITQVLLITPALPKILSLALIFSLIFLLDSIDWQQCLTTKFKIIFILLLLAGGSTALLYRRYALPQKSLPKIYRLSRRQGIQGHKVKIKGVNFGAADKPGKLFLGNQEVVVHSWDNHNIVFYLPVPARYGPTPLYLVTDNGLLSNKVTINIQNPADWTPLYDRDPSSRSQTGPVSTRLIILIFAPIILVIVWAGRLRFRPALMLNSLRNGLEQALNLFVDLIT